MSKCHFVSVFPWRDILKYLQKYEGCTHFCDTLYIYIYIEREREREKLKSKSDEDIAKEKRRYNVSVLINWLSFSINSSLLDYFVFQFFSILSDSFPLFTSYIYIHVCVGGYRKWSYLKSRWYTSYIYIYIYIYIYCMVLTISLGGFVADQTRYNLESAQYLW